MYFSLEMFVGGARRSSFVHMAAVCNVCHRDDPAGVVDCVDNPVIAYPNAPLIFVAPQLSCILRAVGYRPAPESCDRSGVNSVSPSASNSFCAECLISRAYLSHVSGCASDGSPGIARTECPFSLRRDSEISPSSEVLPERLVFLEVD